MIIKRINDDITVRHLLNTQHVQVDVLPSAGSFLMLYNTQFKLHQILHIPISGSCWYVQHRRKYQRILGHEKLRQTHKEERVALD